MLHIMPLQLEWGDSLFGAFVAETVLFLLSVLQCTILLWWWCVEIAK